MRLNSKKTWLKFLPLAVPLFAAGSALQISCGSWDSRYGSDGDESISGVNGYGGYGAAPPPTSRALAAPPKNPTPISDDVTGTLKLPIPGSKDNAIPDAAQKLIVDAVMEVKKTYYDDKKYATVRADGPPPFSELDRVPCGQSYGYLACEFYRHMPSYNAVTPNIRGCFSFLANGKLQVPISLWSNAPVDGLTRPATYAESFDHCLYTDYDAAVPGKGPPQDRGLPWDTDTVAKNKKAGNEIGTLKYLTPAVRAAFKYVMYNWYEPNTFRAEDQSAVVAKIYGAYGATPRPLQVRFTHPDAPMYIQAMNDYIAAHKGKI